MLTIDQIAEKMGVSKTDAYGLIRFFESAGVLKTEGKAPRGEHQRGRSAHLYRFNDEIVSEAASLLAQLVEPEAVAAEPASEVTAAPAEETCVVLAEQPAQMELPATA